MNRALYNRFLYVLSVAQFIWTTVLTRINGKIEFDAVSASSTQKFQSFLNSSNFYRIDFIEVLKSGILRKKSKIFFNETSKYSTANKRRMRLSFRSRFYVLRTLNITEDDTLAYGEKNHLLLQLRFSTVQLHFNLFSFDSKRSALRFKLEEILLEMKET